MANDSIVVEIGAFAQLWNAIMIKDVANMNPVVTMEIQNIFERLLLAAIWDKPWIEEDWRKIFRFDIVAFQLIVYF